ncbi:hypothetical protein ACFL1H_05595 [Nanoarchaeota archaeon]
MKYEIEILNENNGSVKEFRINSAEEKVDDNMQDIGEIISLSLVFDHYFVDSERPFKARITGPMGGQQCVLIEEMEDENGKYINVSAPDKYVTYPNHMIKNLQEKLK